MEYAIAIFLVAVGAGVLYALYRFYQSTINRAGAISAEEPRLDVTAIQASGDVHSDGLVYLFADQFVECKTSGPMTPQRDKAFCPLTDRELDPADWSLNLLYAAICELHTSACIDYRVVKRDATFLPPFPHKSWELELVQRTPFQQSPVMSALEVAFDLMRARKQQRVAQGKEEPGEVWCPLDELIERAIKVMRQEIGFWERSGVYGDLRNYVASALVAQGYLIQPARETWLDRARSRRPTPNRAEVEKLRPAAENLKRTLDQFRRRHGSPYAYGELEPEEGQAQPLPNVDPSLVTRDEDLDEMPFDDVLRISIFETLISLKQLEPSSGSGI